MTTIGHKIQKLEKALASPATPDNFKPIMKEQIAELRVLEAKELSESQRIAEKKSNIRTQGGKRIKKKAKKQRKITGAKKIKKSYAPKPKKKAMLPKLVKSFNKGRGASDVERDRQRTALKPGKRTSAEGNTYYENRSNRADHSKRFRLKKGGSVDIYKYEINEDGKWREATKKEFKEWYDNFGYEVMDRFGKEYKKGDIAFDQVENVYNPQGYEIATKTKLEKGGSLYKKGGSMYNKGGSAHEHSETCGCDHMAKGGSINKLLKDYHLNSDMQYYEMIVDSVINGQRTQAKQQFSEMPKENRIAFIKAVNGSWNSGLERKDIDMLTELI